MELIATFAEFCLVVCNSLKEADELYMAVKIVIHKEDLSIRGILATHVLLYPSYDQRHH